MKSATERAVRTSAILINAYFRATITEIS